MNAKTVANMAEGEKVVLFVMGTLDELVAAKVVERGRGASKLTRWGVKLFRELVASGYTPDQQDVQEALLEILG